MRHTRRWASGNEGTRFLLFPQPPFLENFLEPEIVTVSSPAGSIGPGPSDDRMYAIHPVGKDLKYGFHVSDGGEPFMYLPAWHGDIMAPAMPDEAGHFDHLEPGTLQFETAHLFGTAHFALDVWEGYFGRPIPWHFADAYDRLELTILPSLANAIIGWGFLEAGVVKTEEGVPRAFSMNFDVIAHEIGHAVDVSLNSGDDRRKWLDARGIPDAPWWPGEGGVNDFKSGAGDFAEGFAAWQVGTGSYRSKLGSAPNSAQLELIAQLAN